MSEQTVAVRETELLWGEELEIDEAEFDPTMWAHIDSRQGHIFVAVERVDGRTARAQVIGAQHVSDVDYVGGVFTHEVSREQSLQEIAEIHLDEPEQSIANYLAERGSQ